MSLHNNFKKETLKVLITTKKPMFKEKQTINLES